MFQIYYIENVVQMLFTFKNMLSECEAALVYWKKEN